MEQLQGRRIKIVGQAPDNSRPVARPRDLKEVAEEECQLSKYFANVIYTDSTPEVIKHFAANSIFIGCLSIDEAPRKTVVETVNLNGVYHGSSRSRGSNSFAFHSPESWASRRRENIIIFKFDEKNFHRAYFYKDSKTLITGTLFNSHQHGVDYLNLMITYLKANNLINLIERAEAVQVEAPATVKKGIEFHGGQRVFVNLLVDRKTVTVGCDPEFEWLNERNRPASPPSRYSGTAANIELGKDGSGNQIEVRPKAFEKPSDVVSYMISIMKRCEGDKLSAKGDAYPLGGHIHVGVGSGWQTPRDLRFLLDYYLGKPTINLSGSARGSYRKFATDDTDACRVQNWGFEYRTCPASIFSSPEFARLALKIAKNVTECYINKQTMIINEVPTFEDYWNYAGLTPREYERWIALISDYSTFMRDAGNGYRTNMLDAWLSNEAIAQFPSQINPDRFARLEAENSARVAARDAERTQSADMARVERESMERTLRERARARDERENRPRSITFSDDWTPEVRGVFETVILRDVPVQDFPTLHLHLFGLAESRGNTTFGYTVEGVPVCAEPNPSWTGFGVSRGVRMTGLQIAEAHAEAIARVVRASVQAPASVPAVSILDDEGVEVPSAVAEAVAGLQDTVAERMEAPYTTLRVRRPRLRSSSRPAHVSVSEAIDEIFTENS